MKDYSAFLVSKTSMQQPDGIEINDSDINQKLFPFQRDLVRFACRKGRAALFADTGLGKTFMSVEWARLMDTSTLIIAPLSVARQTVKEAKKLSVDIKYCRKQSDVSTAITITNYEMVEHFDASVFGAVVLDESSILKSLDGKTKQKLLDMFQDTPYRLCCTATPAPNDIAEIANHSEFLGVMDRNNMLATFFVHDDNGWRLKGHATQPFYRWMASWGMSVRKPSDLGYSDDGYDLPELSINPVFVDTEYKPIDALFFSGLKGITDRSKVRKATTEERVKYCAEMVNDNTDQWIVWCGLNDEQDAVARMIPDAVSVQGNDSIDAKVKAIESFQDGTTRVLITKAKIAGFGMNFQNCHRMAFLGLSDSWEAYYQCIRRCWRFGQNKPVEANVILSEAECEIWENVQRKDKEATILRDNLIKHVAEYERAEINMQHSEWKYNTDTVIRENYTAMLGDSSERMAEIDDESVDLSVYSPPFMSLYTYTPTERDIGNSKTPKEFFDHFQYIIDHLMRVTKPGRLCCVHVAQIAAMLVRDGYIGIKDFRGKTIEAFQDSGWIFHGECCIDKDPQAQAIRTHSKGLLFVQMHKDASWSRPALADYILIFKKPGDNKVPIQPDLTNDEWIEYARPIWYGIRESDTLNVVEAREEEDERHICPLQLGTIERCIRLWSNPGETICSPFMGIGSEGYMALKLGRKFIGCELKQAYFDVACKNLAKAAGLKTSAQMDIFDVIGADGNISSS